jgi:teichuronic acid biosynthesis glycosyltransferase TuaG
MPKKPLVSVIVTYYKKKNFINKTLNSVLNQTYKNYELILVYDDENKMELQFIKNILSRFKKKKLIINKKNLGVAKSRNIAMKKSKGVYVAFIDSDDLWKKKKLSKQVSFMQKNKCYFSFTSYELINEENRLIGKREVFSDANYRDLYKSNTIGLNTVMMHKSLFQNFFFPNLKTQEDFALWLKLLRKGVKLKHLNQKLSYWKKTKNSLSSNFFQKISDAFKLYYIYEKKNFIFSIYSVIILSINKLIKKF